MTGVIGLRPLPPLTRVLYVEAGSLGMLHYMTRACIILERNALENIHIKCGASS